MESLSLCPQEAQEKKKWDSFLGFEKSYINIPSNVFRDVREKHPFLWSHSMEGDWCFCKALGQSSVGQKL